MIKVFGLIFSLCYASITWLSFGIPIKICAFVDRITFQKFTPQIFEMNNGFYYDVSNNDMPTGIMLSVLGICFILFFWLIKKIKNNTEKGLLKWIIGFAIVFRIILLPGVLIHENDIYRYLWDAQSSVEGINPFKYAPSDLFMYEYNIKKDYYDDSNEVTLKSKNFSSNDNVRLNKLIRLRDQKSVFFNRIGHWQVPTIYPPVTQMLFMLPALINPHSLLLMKILFILFDIGTLFIIIKLLHHLNKNLNLSIIYAWSPLVLFEFSNRGHYDPIPIFLTMLVIYFFIIKRQSLSFFTLALASLSKFFSGVLLPFLIRPFKLHAIIIFGTTFILFYLPYLFWNQTGFSGVFEGLGTYNKEWAYNGSIFAIIHVGFKNFFNIYSLMPAKVTCGGIYLMFLLYIYKIKIQTPLQTLHQCFLAIAGLFIINPVGDPWYYCWIIPFLCFFPHRSWILLSGLLPLSYLNFHSDLAIVDLKWGGISVLSWIIYLPFFIYLCKERVFKSTTEAKIKEELL